MNKKVIDIDLFICYKRYNVFNFINPLFMFVSISSSYFLIALLGLVGTIAWATWVLIGRTIWINYLLIILLSKILLSLLC